MTVIGGAPIDYLQIRPEARLSRITAVMAVTTYHYHRSTSGQPSCHGQTDKLNSVMQYCNTNHYLIRSVGTRRKLSTLKQRQITK